MYQEQYELQAERDADMTNENEVAGLITLYMSYGMKGNYLAFQKQCTSFKWMFPCLM